jgi:hypothetical protein
MARQIDGIALGAIAAGGLFAYAGIKGYSVPQALQNLVKGQAPGAGQAASPITGAAPAASTGGFGTNAQGPTSGSEQSWIQTFLMNIGAPATAANTASMADWIARETPWPPVAANNPLNTTWPASGATDYNSVGVKNYPSAAAGMSATVATIESGRYGDILSALRSGAGLQGRSFAGLSTWSGGGYSTVGGSYG